MIRLYIIFSMVRAFPGENIPIIDFEKQECKKLKIEWPINDCLIEN